MEVQGTVSPYTSYDPVRTPLSKPTSVTYLFDGINEGIDILMS